ncbi:MAG: ABC transporter ATP-binding protein [Hyphomicrobiaceae bacterium]
MGLRFALLAFTMFLAAVADVVGISLLLPILDQLQQAEQPSVITRTATEFLSYFGLSLTFYSAALLIVGAFTIKFFLIISAGIYQSYLLLNLRESLNSELIERLALANYPFLASKNQSHFINLFTIEVDTTIGATKSLANLMSGTTFVGVFLAASFLVNWQMSLLAIVCGGLLGLSYLPILKMMNQKSHELTRKNEQSQHFFYMFLTAMKYLKATGSGKVVVDKTRSVLRQRTRTALVMNILQIVPAAAIEPLAILIGLVFASVSVSMFGQSIDQIVLPLLFLYRAILRFGSLQRTTTGFTQGVGAISLLRDSLAQVAMAKEPCGKASPSPLSNSIELQNIDVELSSTPVLTDISLTMPAGSAIGIVGETGAGKTTLVDVISGVVSPSGGHILWDGKNYSELDKFALRQRIGYITQDPVIFNETLLHNLTLWSPSVDEVRLQRAIADAKADEFIQGLPNGLLTIIGDRGERLSGGQRQRLAIARELYRRPDLLIVDEGTSALDTITEQAVQRTLNKLRGSCTIVLIAHRLSTLRETDTIIVLSDGRIAAQGDWETLSRSEGHWFSRNLQLQNTSGS